MQVIFTLADLNEFNLHLRYKKCKTILEIGISKNVPRCDFLSADNSEVSEIFKQYTKKRL